MLVIELDALPQVQTVRDGLELGELLLAPAGLRFLQSAPWQCCERAYVPGTRSGGSDGPRRVAGVRPPRG